MKIQFESDGTMASQEGIQSLEAVLVAKLPNDYIEFLLETNGGVPIPNVVDIQGLPGNQTDVQEFYGIGTDLESSDLLWNIELYSDVVSQGFLPVANDGGGNLFCLVLNGEELGSIYFVDLFPVYYPDPVPEAPVLYLVAPSFRAFLDQLHDLTKPTKPQSPKPPPG